MARYIGPTCRLCRREGAQLYLKGERCFNGKCAQDRGRSYPPGQHGRRRKKVSPYGMQLREKQKIKRMYGVLERQFRRYFEQAERSRGITGHQLLILLERRLDNVVRRLGFSSSGAGARQLITHGHILVNGRKVDRPSYLIKAGDVLTVREKTRKNDFVRHHMEWAKSRGIAAWLDLNADEFKGTVNALPTREDITVPIQEQLVVELYSK